MSPWTVACQAPLFMGFPRQKYWSGKPSPSPGNLPNPGIEPGSLALQMDSLLSEPPGKPSLVVCVLVTQLCLTLCNPIDCSLQGSSVHGILQGRILEWVGLPVPSPGDLPIPGIEPWSPALEANSLPSELSGKPW